MTIADALINSAIEQPEAEILLAAAVKQNRTWVLAHSKDELSPAALTDFEAMARRRREGEPVAYILGVKEFYARRFEVNSSTLIPRPATELLTEQALTLLKGQKIGKITSIDTEIVAWAETKEDLRDIRLVVDVGTGSGCIGITLACERPDIRVIATDISAEALETAAKNAAQLGVSDRVTFRKGEGLACVSDVQEPFLLISNPPYIPLSYGLPIDVGAYEPLNALYAGEEGTNVLRPMIEAARNNEFCRGFIVECREEQVDEGD